jgi:FkbH-like protein
MSTFSQLKKNLKNDFGGLKSIKLAILGDSATQFLAVAIRGTGYLEKLNIETWEADFNQIERQVFDTSSELYEFKPDIVLIFFSTHKLLAKYNKLKPADYLNLATNHLDQVERIYQTISSNLSAKIIYYNHPEINDAVFGSFANKTEASFLFQLRKINFRLMEFAVVNTNFFIADVSSLQNQIGKNNLFQPAVYINTEMVLSIDVLPQLAAITVALINSLQGSFKKCVILDLDNTTWGGIIGDDGIENIQIGSLGIGKAFTEFQYWIKKLKQRGIIVAVCSKNTESVAKEPFEKHPDMVLKLDDIAVFVANWENKADNIRHIQSVLNIGFDSMVFLDDNPFERNIVRENIPGITVPDLPEDPAEYLEFLYPLNLFETVSFSNEDEGRTKQYQVEAERSILQKAFTNEDDFLQSLNMQSVVEPFNKFNTPRVAQLSLRSNQFNLRTVRYSEADIESIGSNDNNFSFSFTLEDKFGNNGMICVIILYKMSADTLFIDTWLMSCRVLKRGMENFVLNTLANFAKENGYQFLQGEYIPTAKNEMVKLHYPNLGFEEKEGNWILNTSLYKQRKSFISIKN